MQSLLRRVRTLALAALMAAAPLAYGEAPKQMTQVPGWYRMPIGHFEVTALYDGSIALDAKVLTNADPSYVQRLLSRMFVDSPKMQTAVNAYLINTGANLVLVDTGAGKLFGPSLGNVVSNLKAAGYDPLQVDTIVLTHLHGDHVGALTDAGQPAFPKAKVYVPKGDHDFWLSTKVAETAPAQAQPFFKMARDAAAPYLNGGQWYVFQPGQTLVPGIRAVRAQGHTPGHSAFIVESGGQTLLIWGDIVHSYAVQFERPTVAIEFDVDPKQAVASRRALLRQVSENGTLVAGMHLPFPGIGRVRADGKGVYTWVPVEFTPMPPAPIESRKSE